MKPIPLNNTPDLTMTEITKKLFNNKFLSDIQFQIDDQIIYAHSFELMKRSRVFEKQLEATGNETKLIAIDSVKYESFFQFLRFIYTDECYIDDDVMGLELLKLAITYKVIKLENRVVDHLHCGDVSLYLKTFEFCIEENYTLVLDRATAAIASSFKQVLGSPTFDIIQPKTLESILLLTDVQSGVEEIEVFNAVIRWINRYCADHGLILSEHKEEFQRYLNLVRFAAMNDQELFKCVRENVDLFTDHEFARFFKCMMQRTISVEESSCPNSEHRTNLISRLHKIPFTGLLPFSTKFMVLTNLRLTGLRFGTNSNKINEIHILSSNAVDNTDTDDYDKAVMKLMMMNSDDNTDNDEDDDYTDVADIKFTILGNKNWESSCINLGESIILHPGKNYTINVNLNFPPLNAETSSILGPRAIEKILVNDDVTEFVKILESGQNMIEMFFEIM